MTGFTERIVRRALGASGRIQPRIAPVTAPDPWAPPAATSLELELESAEETSPAARRTGAPVAGAGQRGARTGMARTGMESPGMESAAMEPAAMEHAEAEPRSAVHPALQRTAMEPIAAAPPAALTIRSFRARARDLATRARAPVARARPVGPETHESIEQEKALVASGSPGERAATSALAPDVSVIVRPPDEPPASRSGSPAERSPTEARTTAIPASPRPPASWDARSDVAEPDAARWTSPSLEPVPARRRSRAAAEASGPIVRVQIGKVEVRAPSPPAPAVPRATTPDAFVSLRQYLRRGGRS